MTQALGTGMVAHPRWDKYDGYIGNFRSVLAADVNLDTEANRVLACGLDSDGAIVIGAGDTGVIGVMIVDVGTDMQGNLLEGGINTGAGDVMDVGKHGEITNFKTTDMSDDGAQAAGAAGTRYYGHADGSVDDTEGTDGVYVGHTAEATRLIVNVVDVDLAARVYALENP